MCVMWNSAKKGQILKKLCPDQGHGTLTLYLPLSSFVTHYFLRSQIFLLEWTEGFFCLCCDESLMKKLPGWHICFHKCWMKKTKDFLESLSSPARHSKIQEPSGCPPDNFRCKNWWWDKKSYLMTSLFSRVDCTWTKNSITHNMVKFL